MTGSSRQQSNDYLTQISGEGRKWLWGKRKSSSPTKPELSPDPDPGGLPDTSQPKFKAEPDAEISQVQSLQSPRYTISSLTRSQ